MNNFSKYSVDKKLNHMNNTGIRLFSKLMQIMRTLIFCALVFCVFSGCALGFGMFRGILDSAPDINTIHVGPTAYASKALDVNGNTIATLVTAGSNRERVTYDKLPADLVNAFVAIEDERFWQHNGIDAKSILRAIHGVIADDESAGGGSTITQQLIKNNVFGGGLHEGKYERYVRKFQEQYLALELEDQPDLDKRR